MGERPVPITEAEGYWVVDAAGEVLDRGEVEAPVEG
jgi:hypothetical protein